MSKWNELSMKEKSEIMKVAVQNGIYSLSDIKQRYNEFAEGGDTDPLEYTQQRFPGTKEFDINLYKDPSFMPEGGGNIEYMSAEHDTLPYYNNYQKPSNLKGKSVVIYNDRMGDATNEAIALDILSHGLREQDPVWREKYLPTLTEAFEGDAIYNMTDEDKKIYDLNDPEDVGEVVDNYIDGYIRTMAVDDKYRKALNYTPREVFNKEYNSLTPEQQNALTEAYSYIYPTQLPEVVVPGKKHSLGGLLVETALNEYKSGGKIHIKPENRGKFTRLKERTGHSASWFKAHGTPAQKKMAIFALNARHWKHGMGGNLFDGESQSTQQMSQGSWKQRHQAQWYGFLRNKGVNDADAQRLSTFFTAQDGLESAGGTSAAARKKNNYGGMQKGGKNIAYNTVQDYMEDKWKMMNNRFKPALSAKTVDEYATILGNPDTAGKGYLYYVTANAPYDPNSPEWRAAQTQHMHNYINGMRRYAGMKSINFKNNPAVYAQLPDQLPTMNDTLPFMPSNPDVFFNPSISFENPVIEEQPPQPLVEAAQTYSNEDYERQERQNGLRKFNMVMNLLNSSDSRQQEPDSLLSTIGLLSAMSNKNSYGSHIYDGTTESTQQMNSWLPKNYNSQATNTPETYTPEGYAPNGKYWLKADSHTLPEVVVTGKKKKKSFFEKLGEIFNPSVMVQATPGTATAYSTSGAYMPRVESSVGTELATAATAVASPWLVAPGSSFWLNPLTRQIAASTLAGETANTALKLTTGKTWGENMSDAVNQTTGWNPQDSWWGSMLMEASNPFYFTPAGFAENAVGRVGNAIGKTPKVIDSAARELFPSYDLYRTIGETTPKTSLGTYFFDTGNLLGKSGNNYTFVPSNLGEFVKTKTGLPTQAYYLKAPGDIDILKLWDSSYGAREIGGRYIDSGTVPGKFVSYGSPWREAGVYENPALYEFPVGSRRGPSLQATNWKGDLQDYTVDQVYDYMLKEKNLETDFNRDVISRGIDKLKGVDRIEALRALKEEKYPELLENYDISIYGANQTVIPNERWNFDRFLKAPFWKYSENPISGQVQKELMMRWPEAKPLETPTIEWTEAARTPQITAKNATIESNDGIRNLINAARAGDQKSIEIASQYGIPIGEKGVYRFVSKGEVDNILNGQRYNGRFGDGRVDVTSKYSGSTGSSSDYRITFKDDFDLYTGDPRVRLKNEDLGDGWIMDGYSLDDIASIENLKDGTFVPLVRKTPQVTAENAASITPAQWTAAQDFSNSGYGLLNYLNDKKISAFLEGKPFYEVDLGPMGMRRESFPSDWTMTKMPFSEESKEIINNSAKPRILAQAEKDIRDVYDPTIDGPDIEKYVKDELSYIEKQLDEKINEGYELGSDALFKAHDEGKTATRTGGLQLTSDGKIILREGENPERFAVHEWEHRRTNSNIGGAHYGNEKRLLRKAFTKEFRDLSETVPDFKGMNMDDEMVTTVSDTREALLGRKHLRKTDPELQNKMIDKSSDERIFAAVEKANAYGSFYIKKMRELGKLTPELAQNIREALKYVGVVAAPIGIGLGILGTIDGTSNKEQE